MRKCSRGVYFSSWFTFRNGCLSPTSLLCPTSLHYNTTAFVIVCTFPMPRRAILILLISFRCRGESHANLLYNVPMPRIITKCMHKKRSQAHQMCWTEPLYRMLSYLISCVSYLYVVALQSKHLVIAAHYDMPWLSFFTQSRSMCITCQTCVGSAKVSAIHPTLAAMLERLV